MLTACSVTDEEVVGFVRNVVLYWRRNWPNEEENPMTTITLTLPPDTELALREKASSAGVTLEVYLRQLVEKDAASISPPRLPPTFEEMTGPLTRAVQASGMNEEELREFFTRAVRQVRAEKRAKK